ncbi:hypothetical protein SUGI_1057180 [Cryptomeria japonica]|uniref:two-component response regulator ARR17 n=1 Tax=Cryptomeria japonica TaxID=3369 RepID=UPI002414820F|nr:two-component response regulator ARR17 [Cryptomeria japonica]GLJ49781.1 hypothetical protein SUGI_1057180 [Cryptomeria japonica]
MGHNQNEATICEFHVLAVDDSALDRKIIERLLRSSSYQVTSVDSVRKALEFLGLEDDQQGINGDKMKVNMIVTDYSMPELTGYDLLRRVKESSRHKDIPVVIVSSENVESRISRYLSGGAEKFILKPVKLSDVQTLRSHMLHCSSSCRKQERLPSNKRKNMFGSISPQPEKKPRFSEQDIP